MLATVVAVAVAVQGVGFVGREVTDERPGALSVDEVRAALREGNAGTEPTTTSSTSTSTSVAGSASGPTTTVARPSPGGRVASGASSGGSSGPSASGTSGGASGAGTPAPAPSPIVRTYNLVGGSASIRFESGKVTVQWATPNSGYEVDVETYAPDRVEVRFRSEGHESEVTAWWDGGPRDEIDEENHSSGSGTSSD